MTTQTKTKINVPELRFPEFEGEWMEQPLEKLTNRIGDGIHSTPKYDDSGDCFFINGNNLVNGKIVINNTTNKVDESEYEIHKREINDRTILMSINGTIGNLAFYNGEKVILGKSAAYLNLKKNIEINFIYNFLKTNRIRWFFFSELTGTTIKNLSLKTIRETKVKFPSLPEQQKIATFLTAVDKRIHLLTQKKEKLEQYKKGVMQKLFSRELRFRDENGNDYPEWEEKRLGEISKNVMYGLNSSATEFNGVDKYIRITDIDEETGRFKATPLVSPSGKLKDSFLVNEGDILFARTGASTGKSYIYDENDGRIFFAGFLIRFSIVKANPKFVYYQTTIHQYKKWVNVMSMRSGQQGINAEEYKSLKILLPSLPEQQKIASFLSAIDKQIEQVARQIEHSNHWKKGLLQKMFV